MLRPASVSDAANVRVLMQSVPGFCQDWWSDKTIASAIRSAEGLTFVWEDASQLLAFICAHDLGFRAYLSELVVAPSVQHKGIGTRLLQAVEDALRRRGQRILISDVWHDAVLFYRSRGWSPPDAVLLRREL